MFNKYYQFEKKDSEKKISFLYFAMVAIIIFASSLMIFLERYKTYESSISIMLIPKSEKAASDSEHIIENLRILPTKLSFYEKMIRDGYGIEDYFFGLSDDQKIKAWNKEIRVKREGKSSIVILNSEKNNPEESKMLSKAITSNLLNIAGFYYDIKKDIDLRIVEGPIVRSHFRNWIPWSVLSLAVAISLSIVLNYIFNLFLSFFSARKENLKKRLSNLTLEKKLNIKREAEKLYSKMEKEKTFLKKEETEETKSNTLIKKSFAPDNLSFINEDYFRNNIIKSDIIKKEEREEPKEKKEDFSKKEEIDYDREPTQEELKKRLNQLLRGEL